jgi:hypothetical protein
MSFQVAAPIASTSKRDPGLTASNPGPDTSHQRLLDQREILDRLADGEGIPKDEWDGLFAKKKCWRPFSRPIVVIAGIFRRRRVMPTSGGWNKLPVSFFLS